MASQDLQWLLVRNNSSFIVKQKGLGRIFSREPRNLVQLHSYKVRSPPAFIRHDDENDLEQPSRYRYYDTSQQSISAMP